MFINIDIKSKNRNSLEKFLNLFYDFSNNKRLKLSRNINLAQNKTNKKIFTILKSPHVNKTAQEQFESKLFSKSTKVSTFQVLKLLVVLKKIKENLSSEIFIKVKFEINPEIKSKLLISKLKPDLFLIPDIGKLEHKQIECYLLMFNFYGKYKLKPRLNSSAGRAKD